jgi:hypothetical protein
MSVGDVYADDHFREMAKWAHDRTAREHAERERAARADLSCIYDGYYSEDD